MILTLLHYLHISKWLFFFFPPNDFWTWTFTTKRCKRCNMFSLWRAVTSRPNLRWEADGSSVGHPSEKVLLCQRLLSVSNTTEKVWELWFGIQEELKGERNLQAISWGHRQGTVDTYPLSSSGLITDVSHLSSKVLNAKAQLHSFGPPDVFASEIIFKFICVDFHV